MKKAEKKKMDLSSRAVSCPNCRKSVSIPFKPGQHIRVKCTHCRTIFDLKLGNPLRDMMQVKKSNSFAQNVKNVFKTLLTLPLKGKLVLLVLIGIIGAIFYGLISLFL